MGNGWKWSVEQLIYLYKRVIFHSFLMLFVCLPEAKAVSHAIPGLTESQDVVNGELPQLVPKISEEARGDRGFQRIGQPDGSKP